MMNELGEQIATPTTAQYFRRILQDIFRVLPRKPEKVPEDQEAFYAYLKTHSDLFCSDVVDKYLYLCGLLVYGHLEVVDELLDAIADPQVQSLPAGCARGGWPARGIVYLFPLSEDMSPIEDREILRKWIHDNHERLRWDERAGKYVWKDSPPSETPKEQRNVS